MCARHLAALATHVCGRVLVKPAGTVTDQLFFAQIFQVYWLVLGMWNATKGSARVDLVRPVYPRPGQQINLLRMRGSSGYGARRNSYPNSEFMSSSRCEPLKYHTRV